MINPIFNDFFKREIAKDIAKHHFTRLIELDRYYASYGDTKNFFLEECDAECMQFICKYFNEEKEKQEKQENT